MSLVQQLFDIGIKTGTWFKLKDRPMRTYLVYSVTENTIRCEEISKGINRDYMANKSFISQYVADKYVDNKLYDIDVSSSDKETINRFGIQEGMTFRFGTFNNEFVVTSITNRIVQLDGHIGYTHDKFIELWTDIELYDVRLNIEVKTDNREGMVYNPYTDTWSWF